MNISSQHRLACGSILQSPLTHREAETLAKSFAALGDPVRLRILSLLAVHKEICACDFVEPIGKSQPTISHHLKLLTHAGLIESQREGRSIWYRLVPSQVKSLRKVLQ